MKITHKINHRIKNVREAALSTYKKGKLKLRMQREKVFFTIIWLRWVFAFVVGISLIAGKKNIALFIFAISALTSFFENFIEKKYPSLLRSVLDVIADKLLINIALVILAVKNIIPMWAMVIILTRDLLTIIIGTILLYRDLRREFKPRTIGRVTYFFQLMAVLQVIIANEIDWVVMSIALALTIISGIYSLVKSEFRLLKRKRDLDDFAMMKLLKAADFVTLMSVALGVISIIFSIGEKFDHAAATLFIAIFFDYLDGRVAKALKQQNEFGKELDSLGDTVSFGVAPAIFGFSFMQSSSINQMQLNFGIVAFTIFIFCGILRLARYNIMDLKGSFRGMPITVNGFIVPLVYFLKVPANFYPYIFLVLGILMVSSFRIKKIG